MMPTSTAANVEAAETFLAALWAGILVGDGELDAPFEGELRPLRQAERGARPASGYLPFQSIAELAACALVRDRRGEDVYIGPHPRHRGARKGGNESVSILVACFADVDVVKHGLDRAAVLALALAAPFGPPTLAVWSGGGWHFYWVYDLPIQTADEIAAKLHQEAATRLRAWFNAQLGKAAADEMSTADRILRLPGTHNWKRSYRTDGSLPPIVELVVAEAGRRYSVQALLDGLPPLPPPASASSGRAQPRMAPRHADGAGPSRAFARPTQERVAGGIQGLKDAVTNAGGLPWLAECLGIRVHGRSAHCPNGSAHNHGDRKPSLSLGQMAYRCHACGMGGDAFDLWLAVRPGTLKSAIEGLASLVGVPAPARSTPAAGHAGAGPSGLRVHRAARRVPLPGPEALHLLQELWTLVAPLELTEDLRKYLGSRGLTSWAADQLGVRDWRPRSMEVIALLRRADPSTKAQAGFYDEDHHPWQPVAQLASNGPAKGAFIPIFIPGLLGPVAFRWRAFEPGNGAKALAMPGARMSFYGLDLPTPHGFLRPALGHECLMVIEGEPDWWTIAQELGPHVGVIAVCNKNDGWPADAMEALDCARLVVVCTHAPRREDRDQFVDGVYLALVARRGKATADLIFRRFLVSEDQDWNDLHRAEALRRRLDGVVALIEATLSSPPGEEQ